MKELIIGEEYLFSNNGTHWKKDELRKVRDSNSTYRYLTNDFSYMSIKPIEPEERKLYTQSMYDNDEPIEVGMWFKNTANEDLECLLSVDIEGDAVSIDKDGAYVFMPPLPFPDPDELIDGNAYLVKFGKSDYYALYDEDNDEFIFHRNTNVGSHSCTNIRELTVKDK